MARHLPRARPSRDSIAIGLSVAALIVAVLGATPLGAAIAAITIPRASVGTAQLKDSAVTPAKIKPHSLTRAQFANGTLLVGPTGPAGMDAPSFFGSGSSGSFTACASGSIDTIPDGNYVNVTVPAGCIAHVHRLFVRGTLTIGARAALQNDGQPAGFTGCVGGTGGGDGGGGGLPLPGRDLGGAGQNVATSGQWGASPYDPTALVDLEAGSTAVIGLFADGLPWVGGGGGGNAFDFVGCGAGGGGVIRLVARHVVAGAGVTLSAKGGSSIYGASAGAGGGGVIVVVSLDTAPAGVTMDVSGGQDTGSGALGQAGNGYKLWLGP